MRAIVVPRNGGPEVLELRDVPVPEPGEGQLLVDVEAAGVNFRDVYERERPRAEYATPPFVAGVEGAGTVTAVGTGVTEFRAGDRVAWIQGQGSYAEQLLVTAERAVPIPEGVSAELAAAALLQGITAQYLATTAYSVQEGDDVLVHAAAGGVGLLLTQIVTVRGGRVLATASTEKKAEVAHAAGAAEVFGYEAFDERARDLTGGRGVSAVYDGVGRSTFEQSLAALRPRGTMVLFGAASGPAPMLDPQRLGEGSLHLTRPSLHHYTHTRAELLGRAGDVFGWILAGKLEVRVGSRYGLEDARQAQEDLVARRTTGKLVLVP